MSIKLLPHEIREVLINFPAIELSYDNILHHNKVYVEDLKNDVYMLIPKGPKAFVWITCWQNKNVCFVLTFNVKGNVNAVNIWPACFSSSLAYGTVLYGTLFTSGELGSLTHFSCENIFYYKGRDMTAAPFARKMATICGIFKQKELVQRAYNMNFLLLGVPIIVRTYETALQQALDLPYPVYAVQHYQQNRPNPDVWGLYLVKKAAVVLDAVFYVKAAIQADIYQLYCCVEEHEHEQNTGAAEADPDPYAIAMVPTYKSSVFLNSLFRTIKENANLDLLEESDAEDDFEDIRPDKFVNLDKVVAMKCVYSSRFKKWQPIAVIAAAAAATNSVKIINRRVAQMLEKSKK